MRKFLAFTIGLTFSLPLATSKVQAHQASKINNQKPAKKRDASVKSRGANREAVTSKPFFDATFRSVPSALGGRVTLENKSAGVLAFASVRGKNLDSYLSVHRFTQNSSSTTSTYLSRGVPGNDEVVYQPEFSPSGRFVVFKYGGVYSFLPRYNLYVLDRVTGTVKQACKLDYWAINYEYVSWSPDEKYLSFAIGGDAIGRTDINLGSHQFYSPLTLAICNWRTGKLHRIATSASLRAPFSWSSPNTVLYSLLPENKAGEGSTSTPIPRPNVFEYSLSTKTSRLILSDGFRAVPSPNHKLLAFFGSAIEGQDSLPTSSWEDNPQGMSLCVANSDGTGRVALSGYFNSYPSLLWRSATQLLALQQITGGNFPMAELKEWNVQTRKFRVITALRAQDKQAQTRSRPQFTPLSLSPDGKSLFVAVNEVTGSNKSTALNSTKDSIKKIDLDTGAVKNIIVLSNTAGIDWFPF